MKTYKAFVEESNTARQNLKEVALVPIALTALNTALRGAAAYDTYKSVKKGDWVGAGLNALSVVNPLGRKVAPLRRVAPAAALTNIVKDEATKNKKKE